MPLSVAMHADIIYLRPLSTSNRPFSFSRWGSRGCDNLSLFLLPLPAFDLLPFALEVEASPTNTVGADL
ncbi:UNVERIFIED_CONTAM: hypothetical protein Sradi_6469600 [Sesamum radiatum]|uniref:Uncharacterized protein n=1 Tax=Sesamum radiatum TaxID=300843 RepID=A0AAW2K7V0_SESRA